MRHIMFDLETLGNGSHAAIVQLAAMEFNIETGKQSGLRYNLFINYSQDLFKKFDIDFPTLTWWFKQSKEAQDCVFNSGTERVELWEALSEFNDLIGMDPYGQGVRIWSHATFDPPILDYAYRTVGLTPSFPHKAYMDIRTIKFLSGNLVSSRTREEFGHQHDALADCYYQAAYVSEMYRKVKGL